MRASAASELTPTAAPPRRSENDPSASWLRARKSSPRSICACVSWLMYSAPERDRVAHAGGGTGCWAWPANPSTPAAAPVVPSRRKFRRVTERVMCEPRRRQGRASRPALFLHALVRERRVVKLEEFRVPRHELLLVVLGGLPAELVRQVAPYVLGDLVLERQRRTRDPGTARRVGLGSAGVHRLLLLAPTARVRPGVLRLAVLLLVAVLLAR